MTANTALISFSARNAQQDIGQYAIASVGIRKQWPAAERVGVRSVTVVAANGASHLRVSRTW